MDRKYADVFEFHTKLGYPARIAPTIGTQAERDLRKELIREEATELIRALDHGEMHEIAGECVDLLYVVYGTAITLGLDLDPFWRAIHDANMRKEPVLGNKARKPLDWTAPDLEAIFWAQMFPPPYGSLRRAILWGLLFLAAAAAAVYTALP